MKELILPVVLGITICFLAGFSIAINTSSNNKIATLQSSLDSMRTACSTRIYQDSLKWELKIEKIRKEQNGLR